ncbi:hypothetical protein FXV83_14710 [Bradyrhizobium hipponense]|uniref:Uncharacterized protein n=1 Tax=Bradyrhizobium hipponense TaxID=2605638 RepID=A0A5S4YQX9_9BRAD|nr:hypothetical protein FXV83_14710 [Bradyrhizobium hipponense]
MSRRFARELHPLAPSLRGARDKIAKQFCADATKQSRLPPPKDSGLLRSARNDGVCGNHQPDQGHLPNGLHPQRHSPQCVRARRLERGA